MAEIMLNWNEYLADRDKKKNNAKIKVESNKARVVDEQRMGETLNALLSKISQTVGVELPEPVKYVVPDVMIQETYVPVLVEEDEVVPLDDEAIVHETILKEADLGLDTGGTDTETADPLTPLGQNFVTFEELNNHYKIFISRIQQQMSSIGGGGEVNLRYLDDVNRSTIADGLNMQYNASDSKFEFTRPIVSVYPVVRGNNAVLIDSPTPIIITDMTVSPPAGTYLTNFNSQFTVDDTSSQTLQAKADLIVLYDELMALTATGSETDRGANPLTYGSETLGPGVYIQTGAINVTGTLTLDAGGDPNALFVFRTAGAFTTGVGAEVVLTGGATSNNVFFVSQGAASTAADAIFRGTILANQAAVSTGAGTQLEGRMLAINGAVSLGAASILTAPTGTINSSLTLGNVLALFNMFSGQGGISSTGASEVQLSVGTNYGAITGFDTATVGGSIIPGGAGTLTVFRCALYVDGVIAQDSLRSTSRPFVAERFEFPIILQTVLTLTEGQTVDVRAYSELGLQTVGPRMSLILTLVQP
jgi:hypothetical protein